MVAQQELGLGDYVAILLRRWPIIVGLALVGGGIGFGAAHYLPKRYTSQTLVLVEQPTVPGDYVKPVVSEDTNQRLASMQQEILSRSRLEPLIQQFGLYRDEQARVPTDDMVDRLRKAVTVTPIQPMAETRSQGLPGFTISVTFNEPHLAQQICSTITSMFMEENLKLRQQQAEQTTQFLAKQLDDAKVKLDDQDTKLAAFKRLHLGSLPDEEQANLNLLMGLNSQLDASTQALARAQQDKSFAESMLAQQLSALQSVPGGQNPQTLDQQLALAEAQLSALKLKYTANHPDVVKAQSDVETLKKQVAEAQDHQSPAKPDASPTSPMEPQQILALRAQIHQYDQQIKERTAQQDDIRRRIGVYQERVQSSPAIEQEYKELTRDYQTALEFYNDLLKKRDQSAMAVDLERRQQGEQFEVLDPANLPDKPSFPKMPLFLAGGSGGGFALGLAIVFLLELQDTSMRTERDVEAHLHLPVLAMVPEIKLTVNAKTKEARTRAVLRV